MYLDELGAQKRVLEAYLVDTPNDSGPLRTSGMNKDDAMPGSDVL